MNRIKKYIPLRLKKLAREALPNKLIELIQPTAMHKVIKMLGEKGINVKKLDAIELFGGEGQFHTEDYASKVGSLTIWEIHESNREILKNRFSKANIKVTDSFSEIEETTERFTLIVSDNPMIISDTPFPKFSKYHEHFELFPNIFNLVDDFAIFVLNVIPEIDKDTKEMYPKLFDNDHLKARSEFYGVDNPKNISIDMMIMAYSKYARRNGYKLVWHFSEQSGSNRIQLVYYCVFMIEKIKQS